MRGRISLVLTGAMTCAALLSSSVASAPSPAVAAASAKYYLVLGDSLGYGYVNSDTALDPQCKTPQAVGYACIFYSYLQKSNSQLQVNNLSDPGMDSCNLLYGYPGPSGQCQHAPTGGNIPSILQAAVNFLNAHPGQVDPITLDVGGIDLLTLLPEAVTDPQGAAAQLPAVFRAYQSNLDSALSQLRAAAPKSHIILITQYNPLGGIGSPPLAVGLPGLAAAAINSLNNIMKQEAPKYGVAVADVAARFDAQPGGASTLTEVPSSMASGDLSQINIHPTVEGYQIYSQVVIQTYQSIVPPTVQIHLSSRVVSPKHKEVVSGQTEPQASVTLIVRYPHDGRAHRYSVSARPDGSFQRTFRVGPRSGKGTVQGCAQSSSGQSACSGKLSYTVR